MIISSSHLIEANTTEYDCYKHTKLMEFTYTCGVRHIYRSEFS